MTQKYSRAQRRADYARLKKKRQYHWGYGHKNGWGREAEGRGEICFMTPRVAGGVVNTPTPCSCEMCRNERNSAFADNPLTMQERRALDYYNDSVEEYYDWISWSYWDWYEDNYDTNPWTFELEYNYFETWKWARARGWIN